MYYDAVVDVESDCNWEFVIDCIDDEEQRLLSVLLSEVFSIDVFIFWPCLAKSARKIALKSIVLVVGVEEFMDESGEEFFIFCWCSRSKRLRTWTEGKQVCFCCGCCWEDGDGSIWAWEFVIGFVFDTDDLRRFVLSVEQLREELADSWRIKYEWSW